MRVNFFHIFFAILPSFPTLPGSLRSQLICRNEAIRTQKRSQSHQKSDYPLGVYDEIRIGTLRFKLEPDGKFVNSGQTFALDESAGTGVRLMRRSPIRNEHEKLLSMLIVPSSSLEGARRKRTCSTRKTTWGLPNYRDHLRNHGFLLTPQDCARSRPALSSRSPTANSFIKQYQGSIQT